MRIRNTDRREHIVLQMTPMIDIVFQLLVFFVFTFKIVLPEGDFNIRMPSATASTSSEPSETPLLRVVMRANENRELAGLQLGDRRMETNTPFFELQQEIRKLVGDDAGPARAIRKSKSKPITNSSIGTSSTPSPRSPVIPMPMASSTSW